MLEGARGKTYLPQTPYTNCEGNDKEDGGERTDVVCVPSEKSRYICCNCQRVKKGVSRRGVDSGWKGWLWGRDLGSGEIEKAKKSRWRTLRMRVRAMAKRDRAKWRARKDSSGVSWWAGDCMKKMRRRGKTARTVAWRTRRMAAKIDQDMS